VITSKSRFVSSRYNIYSPSDLRGTDDCGKEYPVNYSRRDLAILLPALAAASAEAQDTKAKNGAKKEPAAPPQVLKTQAWEYKDMKPEGTGVRPAVTVFSGITTRGQQLNIHLSELGPGAAPHPPHVHANEELVFIVEGTLEFDLDGKEGEFGHGQLKRVGPGSIALMASMVPHAWHNVGTTRARYYVLAVADHS
jgi:quercetin dioxygenase-like cupin family protein